MWTKKYPDKTDLRGNVQRLSSVFWGFFAFYKQKIIASFSSMIFHPYINITFDLKNTEIFKLDQE